MSKTRILELEDTLLDQIEKLNDDSLMDNEEDVEYYLKNFNVGNEKQEG